MRSRNGNRPILLAGIAVAASLSFGADHYYIGYRLSTHNAQPVGETFTLSKAMLPCPGSSRSVIVFDRSPGESLQGVLEREKSPFLEYALEDAARVASSAEYRSVSHRVDDTLTLPTQCYAVEFNDGFVTIGLLK